MGKKGHIRGEIEEKEFLEEEILRDYDLQVVKKVKPCRGAYRVPTDRGLKMLKKSGCSEEELRFICYFLEHLARQGFKKTARFIFTKYGEPYLKHRGDIYYLTDWIDGKTCDLKKINQLEEAVATLAHFHQASSDYQPPGNAHGRAEWGHWEQKFIERSGDLANWSEMIAGSVGMGEFSRVYNNHLPTIQKQACLSLGLLEGAGYQDLVKKDKEKGVVCHRDFTARNLIRTKRRGIYVVDFDHCIQDLRIHDLARLMSRYLPKYSWDVNIANRLVSIYNSTVTISPEEIQLLLAYLAFPRKSWRLAKRYYGRTRNWSEQEALEKLYKVISESDLREQFIKNFASIHNISLQVRARRVSAIEEQLPIVEEEEGILLPQSKPETRAAAIEPDPPIESNQSIKSTKKPKNQTKTLIKLDDDFLQGKNGWKVFKKNR